MRMISKTGNEIQNFDKWSSFSLFISGYFINAKNCRKTTLEKLEKSLSNPFQIENTILFKLT